MNLSKVIKSKVKNNDSSLKLLDCTLRDGGYYNNWDFDLQLIQEHIEVMSIL